MKKNYGYILILILAFQFSKATSWVTISAGYWNSPSVWAGGLVPPLSSSDTFNIKHPVAIYNNLFFNSGSLLQVDSSGGLCGHNNVTIRSGAKFVKYGIFEIDSLIVPGGKVYMYGTGSVTLTCSGIITNGGSMIVSGCAFQVGPWFNCRNPEYSFTGIEEINKNNFIKLFPNPVSNTLNISDDLNQFEKAELEITNYLGQTILKIPFSNYIDVSKTPQGFYNLRINTSDQQIYISKFVKE